MERTNGALALGPAPETQETLSCHARPAPRRIVRETTPPAETWPRLVADDKYAEIDRRRRRAQIAARHALDRAC